MRRRYEQIRSLPVLVAFTIIALPLSIGDGILNAFVYAVFFQVGYLCTSCCACRQLRGVAGGGGRARHIAQLDACAGSNATGLPFAGVAVAFGFAVFSLLYKLPSTKRMAIFIAILTVIHASAVAVSLSYLHGRLLFFALPAILLTLSVVTIVFMGHAAVESYVTSRWDACANSAALPFCCRDA